MSATTIDLFQERMTAADRAELVDALTTLARPSLAIRLAASVGKPLETALTRLPPAAQSVVHAASHQAIEQALAVAIRSLVPQDRVIRSERAHRVAAMATGAAGGLFGLAALSVELPASTILMLRSIADIARYHGEDLGTLEARLACLEVLALGGTSPADDRADIGYLELRLFMASQLKTLSAMGLSQPIVRQITRTIASRFGIVVTDKIALQLVPLVGAASGAAVNLAFMDHFQRMADGHFTVRRLERRYGADLVRNESSASAA